MSAQPVHYEDPQDPRDPQVILANLPERAHEAFLTDYRAAVAAAHQPAGYKALQRTLQEWSVRAVSYSTPGFFETAHDALAGRGDYVPLEDLMAEYERQHTAG